MVRLFNVTRGNYRRIRDCLGIKFELGRVKCGPDFSIEPPAGLSASVDLRTNVTVGAFTYISPTDGIGRFIHNCDIGRYCSIAAGVCVAPDDHPTTWLTSSPMVYNRSAFKWFSSTMGIGSALMKEWTPSKRVRIGNDVWIGHGAFIRQGIAIGDGAVIAAHAVVVKDVPPYAIVGGCPAKVIKYRFDEQTIRELLELKWWQYDIGQFGVLDWSDVRSAMAKIRERIREGLKPYAPQPVRNGDFGPYARSTPFVFEIGKDRIRLKLFGLWLIHWIRKHM